MNHWGKDKAFKDGEPGDCFMVVEDDDWAIWKHLDGADLELAHELGYGERVVACILTGNSLNPPSSPKTDELDPPYAMLTVGKPSEGDTTLNAVPPEAWTYLGKL